MKKQLAIYERHNMVTPLFYGNILSILLTDDRILPWVNSNYVLVEGIEWGDDQDCLYGDGYGIQMETSRVPEFLEVNKRILKDDTNSIALIEDAINQNEYVYLQLDEFYVNQCTKGDEEHLLHDLLVYGYHQEEEIVYALGVDKNLHYGKIEASYESIEMAIKNRKSAAIWNPEFVDGAYQNWADSNSFLTIKYRPDAIQFKYDVSKFIDTLELYITEKPRVETYFTEVPSSAVYMGIHYYDLLIKNTYVENGYRLFVLINHLYEHKASMLEKLKYLFECLPYEAMKELVNRYKTLVYGNARKLQLNMLRINVMVRRSLMDSEQLTNEKEKIIQTLRTMKQDEFAVLNELVSYTRKYGN